MIDKILCFFGRHDWDLKFFDRSLHTYEECTRCKKRQTGWLR